MRISNEQIGSKIRKAREMKGWSLSKLGEVLGVHGSTVKRYEDGDIKSLSIEKLVDFAVALNQDPTTFLRLDLIECEINDLEPLYPPNSNLKFLFDVNTINIYANIRFNIEDKEKIDFENLITTISTPYPYIKSGTFGLQIHDDSMNKVMPKYVYAILEYQSKFANGDIVAFIIDDQEALLRRVYLPDKDIVILKPESYDTTFEPIVLMGKDQMRLRVIGRYVGHISPYID